MDKNESDNFVPTLKLCDIDDRKLDITRINELKSTFQNEYSVLPDIIIRVPGRVNIIGEHIDYCGYPVLPMAIEQCFLLATSPLPNDMVLLRNSNENYQSFKVSMKSVKIEPTLNSSPQWYNYFLCGIKGIMDHLQELNKEEQFNKGFMVVVDGNIPPAAGLSSSSALVCAAVLATAYIYNVSLNKKTLASIASKCERYIGTQGGGMDQAIAFLAKQGTAQFIEWNPLTATPISLPPNAVFVIANSLTKANKAATHDFNQRVVECRLGCKLLANKLNQEWRDFNRFSDLQTHLGYTFEQMIKSIDTLITKPIYTRKELLMIFDISDATFKEDFLSHNTQHLEEFKIRQRALHVVSEASRVKEFCQNASDPEAIKILMQLMCDSHQSLHKLYECSTVNLNQIVKIGLDCGMGARLTGAGWGGCAVVLCDSSDNCQNFMKKLRDKYYNELEHDGSNNLKDALFMTCPQRGAEIWVL